MFPLYKELTARDMMQRTTTDAVGNTTWTDSPLVLAAREGSVCILDGVDRLDAHALGSLRSLIQDGVVDLPSGERLTVISKEQKQSGMTGILEGFRIIALGTSAVKKQSSSSASDTSDIMRFSTSDLGFSYHYLPQCSSADIEEILLRDVSNTPNAAYRIDGLKRLAGALMAIAEESGSTTR